jgi:pSer/pThr/pTyr-binding forkhead associated (FHA) protein
MINCQTCGTPNLDASQYCDECGARLMNKANQLNELSSFETRNADIPVFQSSNVTSVGIPNIAKIIKDAERTSNAELETKAKSVHATLIIERSDAVGTEFQITADESLIGRWDADNGIFPDVDLDRHDPEAKISRRHARILHKNGQYSIEDLGSTNGTYVNRGRRLIPGSAQLLKNEDEIIVGKTFLRFYISH